MAKSKLPKNSYGAAELYGESFIAVSNQQRVELLDAKPAPECPHLASFPALAPVRKKQPVLKCSKKGGVCSIRNFIKTGDGQNFGPITAACPIRFYQDGLVFREIGETLLGDRNALTAKEIPFLKSPKKFNDAEDAENSSAGDVGRIDLVMVSPAKKVQDGRIGFVLVRGIGQAFVSRDVEASDVAALLNGAIAA